MALPEGLAVVLVLELVHETLRRAVAGRAVLDADRIVGLLEGIALAPAETEDELLVEESVMAPELPVRAELQAPDVGVVEDVLASLGGLLPLGPVIGGVEQRRSRVEQRTGLEGVRGDAGGAADFGTDFRRVGNREIRRDRVQFVDDELHDLVGRGPLDAVRLRVGERRRHERHVAVGAEQFEIEVGPQETELIREELQLLGPDGIVRVVLPGRDVRLVDLLQIHADIGDGRIGLVPDIGIRVGRAPASVHVVVHRAGLQRILGLVGGAGEEISAVVFELAVVDLRVDIEHHVLDTILEVFVRPFLVPGGLLRIVEVDARDGDGAGENE